MAKRKAAWTRMATNRSFAKQKLQQSSKLSLPPSEIEKADISPPLSPIKRDSSKSQNKDVRVLRRNSNEAPTPPSIQLKIDQPDYLLDSGREISSNISQTLSAANLDDSGSGSDSDDGFPLEPQQEDLNKELRPEIESDSEVE